MTIKTENWKGELYFVARDTNGRILAKQKRKGSNLTRLEAEDIFRKNNTFSKSAIKQKSTLTNFTEIIVLNKSNLNQRNKKPMGRRPRGENVLYQVSGMYKGQLITARSQKVGADYSLSKTSKDAKERAWESFLERIAQKGGLDYDADEGIKEISKVSNIREGWVTYNARKSTQKNKTATV